MKIAFCFLTYDEIIRYDIWNKFFSNIDINKYIVFIHPKIVKQFNNYTFNYNIVKNRINTIRKEDISIVKATIKLLEETYNYDNSITHFIFLTQSCIPLYSFNILYSIITKFPLSVISYIINNKMNRYYQLKNNIKKYIIYNKFIKQQPNMILIRKDVELLINNNLTEYFINMECPDEHYFVNVISNIFKKEFIKKQINFCNLDFNKTQAIEFNNVNKILIEKIRNYGFLFMRKINKQSYLDIEFLLENL
jgi:hypothetical protein